MAQAPNAPRKPRRSSNLDTNTAPAALPDDLRQTDMPQTPPDSLPPRESERTDVERAGGGFTPLEDGGVSQHPIHDDDPSEDATPSDYEREIERLDAAARRN